MAQANLGRIDLDGRGVPQDYIQAATWYRESGEPGRGARHAHPGAMHANSHGVPQDFVLAYMCAVSVGKRTCSRFSVSAFSDPGTQNEVRTKCCRQHPTVTCKSLSVGSARDTDHSVDAPQWARSANSCRLRAFEPTQANGRFRRAADSGQLRAGDGATPDADVRRKAVPVDSRCRASVSLPEPRTRATDPNQTAGLFRSRQSVSTLEAIRAAQNALGAAIPVQLASGAA
jgi:hypothetical protein